jgi:4-hydroxy-2-oxoglutarate aldolase
MKLEGIFPPLTTPFRPDESLALDELRANVKRYNATGVAGYVVTGSTGEAVLLCADEIEKVWAAVAEAAAPGLTLIAGTGTDSTAETIRRTNRAAALGYHCALVKTPYYYKPQMTSEAQIEHFHRVAEGSRIPILIYVVPQFTGVALEAPTVARLAEHPNVAGIKESSGQLQRIAQIIQSTPPRFQTLVGSGTTIYPSLALGAVGGILAVADFLPELCVEVYESVRSRDFARAHAAQFRLLEPTAVIVGKHGVAGVKYAMERRGYYGGPARRPFLPLTAAQRKEIDATLAAATEEAIGATSKSD